LTPEQFVECCVKEKESFIQEYMNPQSESSVAQGIASLDLSDDQKVIMRRIIAGALTDAFYTFLLALDGAASLGGEQVSYKLHDEEGNELTGELEGIAWECFHGRL
jgi:hypothetical protein